MPFGVELLSRYFLAIVAFFSAFGSALWLSLIFWTYRDLRARTADVFAPILAALVVAVLNLPGLIIYLILRPPQTLSERYAQSLEEEALLQEIEEKQVCPGCSRQIKEAWLVCPNCHTRLKKPCAACGRLMELPWNLCPYCAAPTEGARAAVSDQPQADEQS